MLRELPLIWFCGVGQGVYRPVFPVYLLWEESEHQQFVIDPDIAHGLVDRETPVTEHLRRYIRRETWQRLHQPVFRATVLRAYETRCSVCALRHHQLLDAAHIVPDREEAGVAAVRNGLALCKIHHAAYDCHVLGIRPDLVVEIRADLLNEVDGPMLEHGLKGRHGQPLMALPAVRGERPDRELLDPATPASAQQGDASSPSDDAAMLICARRLPAPERTERAPAPTRRRRARAARRPEHPQMPETARCHPSVALQWRRPGRPPIPLDAVGHEVERRRGRCRAWCHW
jgi:hypothetical protein